jgi:GntR family transcriptional regulator, rspAB operon transcriptional repressor
MPDQDSVSTPREKLSDTAYARLRDSILRGELPPRSVLDQRQLAESLDSSRTPVREALGRLLQEGLVEVGSRRQVIVRDFTPGHRREIALLREALETVAVRQACSAMKVDDLDLLRLVLIQQRRAAREGRNEAFLELDERFHLRIAEGAQLPILHAFLGQLGGFVRVATLGARRSPAALEQIVEEHERIVDAIEARDEDGAVAALEEHLGRNDYPSAAASRRLREEALR